MNTVTNDVKQLAQQIESLAKEIQTKLDNGTDVLTVANELARNNVTFLFTLGEYYAQEQSTKAVKVKAKVVKNPAGTVVNRNYHNVRDNNGRFVRKV